MIFEIIVALIFPPILYFIVTYIEHVWKLKNYPNGPFPLPVIGNLNLLSPKPYEDFSKLSEQYGDVFGFSFGMNRYVIVNSAESAKEAFITKGEQFAGRPNNMDSYKILSRGYINLSFSEGGMWKLLRRVTHSALKVYGENMERFNQLVVTESEYLHKVLREKEGKEVDPRHEIGCSVLNIICKITFGERYERDDAEFKNIIKFQELIFAGLKTTDIVMFLPWMKMFHSSGFSKLKAGIAIRDPILKRKVQEHKKAFDPDNIRDFTDGIIALAKDKLYLQKFGIQSLNDDNLEMITNDIFVGGNETTTTTISWFIVYMIRWPQYQETMYQEIINTIGYDRYPTFQDRDNLPFVHACILELLRRSTIAPLGVPRKSLVYSSLSGKAIPENTQVLFNFWKIHMDKTVWTNPEEFNPYRWLDESGKLYEIGKYKNYMPFSAGIRGCPGEVVAKIELFVLLSRLIRDFHIGKVESEPTPSLDGELGITLSPHPFKVKFISRNNNS